MAGVIITVEMVIKPELAEAVSASIPAMFEDTVKFKGFRSIRVVAHQEQNNRLLIIEHWNAAADYQAYHDWRNRDGALDRASESLLSLTTEIWPALVGFAAV